MPEIQKPSYSPFSDAIVRLVYSVLILVLIPLVLLSLYVKSKKRSPDYFKRKRERFGIIPAPVRTGGILFHCVSVGEVVAATPAIRHVLQQHPHIAVTVTTTTPTGSEQVRSTFGDQVNHCYLPYDFPLFVNQLLSSYQPEKVIITEVELWPNLIHACKKRGISTWILNARLTEKSAQSYKKLALLFRPMLLKIDGICAQSQRDIDNYRILHSDLPNLHLTGNLKFDQALQPQDLAIRDELRSEFLPEQRPVIIGASTHEPEEAVLLEACQKVWRQHSDTLLLLVPRHPQRFEKVNDICRDYRLNVQMLSDNQPVSANTQVLIADRMGILKSLYGLADMAFVGGSIADRGGHNALEAALHHLPVVMGPHIYNNPGICDALKDAGALYITENADAISTQFMQWLDQPEQAKSAGESGHNVIEQNAGALQRQLSVIGIS